MSTVVAKNLPLLEVLATAKPDVRKKILKTADYNLIQAIVECIQNVLQGIVKLSTAHKCRLKRHKKTLRGVMKGSRRWINKKKIICQKGGAFPPALLAPVLTVLAERFINR